MYYGSATENDMDFWSIRHYVSVSIFEGFSRPINGVRTIIKALQDQYRSLEVFAKMRCGVTKILSKTSPSNSLF